ncbi:MAG: hypothetical protein OMM_15053, partial [Candidatus Magnetoglobus multicellularis str. Araruama]
PLANSPLWVVNKPGTKILSINNGIKRLYLWIKDSQNKISEQAAVATINYDTVAPSISSIKMYNAPDIQAGTHTITINLTEEIDYLPYGVTPSVWLALQGSSAELLDLRRITDAVFTASLTVDGATPEGEAVFSCAITDNAKNTGSVISSGGTIYIDRTEPSISAFNVSDKTSTSEEYSDEREIALAISGAADISVWYVTENASYVPTAEASVWEESKPVTYNLED